MSLHFNIWQLSQSEEEREFQHLFSEINHQEQDIFLHHLLFSTPPTTEPQDPPLTHTPHPTHAHNCEQQDAGTAQRDLGLESCLVCEVVEKGESTDCHPLKKGSKPSPYHNFQKHLSVAIKHLLTPSASNIPASSRTVQLALALWTVFTTHPSPSKKLLHFIFNEYNEYEIEPAELKRLGFEAIYKGASREQLVAAKGFLTQVGLQQLREERVEEYLQGRRIRNAAKFKRYMMLFRKELEQGFIKKRFTNRSRKTQMHRPSY